MTASMHETQALQHPAGPRQGHDAEVTQLDLVRVDRHTTAQQRRRAARSRDLTALLRERPDLSGVHAPADFTVDAVRWCV